MWQVTKWPQKFVAPSIRRWDLSPPTWIWASFVTFSSQQDSSKRNSSRGLKSVCILGCALFQAPARWWDTYVLVTPSHCSLQPANHQIVKPIHLVSWTNPVVINQAGLDQNFPPLLKLNLDNPLLNVVVYCLNDKQNGGVKRVSCGFRLPRSKIGSTTQ